jgi:hypothetical protein
MLKPNGETNMKTTQEALIAAYAEIATALTMWNEGCNASEVLQVALNAKDELNKAIENMHARVGD